MNVASAMRDRVRLLAQDKNARVANATLLELANDAISEVFTRDVPRDTVLASASTGWSMTAGGYQDNSESSSMQDVRRILGVQRHTTLVDQDVAYGFALEWVPFSEIVTLITNETTQGAPTKYHVLRRHFYYDFVSSNVQWRLLVHPICDGVYHFSARAEKNPSLLSDMDGSNQIPLSALGADVAARIAAARVARLIGQSEEFIGNLWRGVDESYAKLERQRERLLGVVP